MSDRQQARGKMVAAYPYHDESGKLLYEACRIEPGRDGRKKDFSFRRPQEGGAGWIYNLEGVKKVLYRLPEIIDGSKKHHPVFLVEGEGKADALRNLGFLATSAPCGAGHWQDDFGPVLSGRRVVVLPDNDKPGWDHGVRVVAGLVAWHAAAIWLIHLPGLTEGGDVVDWLARQTSPAHKRGALIELVTSHKRWELKEGEKFSDGLSARQAS